MKRIILSFAVIICLSISCEKTEQVSVLEPEIINDNSSRSFSEAIKIAQKSADLLNSGEESTRSKLKRNLDLSQTYAIMSKNTRSSTIGDTLMYIFNFADEQGYAIIPKNANAPELIAVTEKGSFDGISSDNEGLNMYMEEMSSYLSSLPRLVNPPVLDTNSLMEQVIVTERDSVIITPKVAVEWGQGMPYCLFCFEDGATYGEQALTGCVQTAMAQIMSYFQYPAYIDITYDPTSIQNMEINWTQVNRVSVFAPNVYIGDYISLAYIMRELGQRTMATYYDLYDGTGTDPENIASAFHELGYDADYVQPYHITTVINSLQGNGLIVINAADRLGVKQNHSWVIDGLKKYVTTDEIYHRPANSIEQGTLFASSTMTRIFTHFNWGRDGEDNGFFLAVHTTKNNITGSISSESITVFQPTNDNTTFTLGVSIVPHIKPAIYN